VAFGHDKSYKNGTLHFYEKALTGQIATITKGLVFIPLRLQLKKPAGPGRPF
jgi:hypothetical protein